MQLKQQLDQADRLYRSGHFAQAEQAYLVLLNSNPAQSIVHYRLGNIAFKKGEHKVAADHFQQAIKLAPNDAKAHYNLAVAYLSLAELHLKNYSGTLSRDADTSKITRLLREINKFAMNKSVQTTEKDALDALADALE
ncbi:MAG: tetratricopeptide repeat protein [Gammaproteobacteria bacterium]